jgi:hypothetical protein
VLVCGRCVGIQVSSNELTCQPKVISSKVVGGFVGEVVDEPAVTERAVGYIGDVELAGGGDEAVGFVQGFEGGVFGLDGVDFGDCEFVSDDC